MPTYISLLRYTEEGARTLKQRREFYFEPNRNVFLPALGVTVKNIYMVLGQYDAVAILEAPNDEAVAKAALFLGSVGTVHTETMRAFNEEESGRLIDSMPG
jgi:uncharacterized protein with GYD domain